MPNNAITPMGGAEACQMLGISRDTMVRLIARGVIKRAHKLAGEKGQWVLDRTEIEQLAAEKAQATA